MRYIEDKEVFYDYLYVHCHCCNAGQHPDDRRLKYAIARWFGCSSCDAMIYRDWNNRPFAKWFGFDSWDNLLSSLKTMYKGGDKLLDSSYIVDDFETVKKVKLGS